MRFLRHDCRQGEPAPGGTGPGRLEDEKTITVEEAAIYLGRSKEALQHMVASGKLATVKADRRVFLDIKDLDLWIDRNKI
jgi:excisionase family DNA binding protein